MRVLVTGAAGFIGSQVSRLLVARGDEVTAVVLPGEPRPRLDGLSPLAIVELDLASRDASALDSLFESARPEVVVHLAWYADPRDYLTSPSRTSLARRDGSPRRARLHQRVGRSSSVSGPASSTRLPAGPSSSRTRRTRRASMRPPSWLRGSWCERWPRVSGSRPPGPASSTSTDRASIPLGSSRRCSPRCGPAGRSTSPLESRSRDYLHVSDVASAIATLVVPRRERHLQRVQRHSRGLCGTSSRRSAV